MRPVNGRPSTALPPRATGFGHPHSLPQAVADIQQAGQQLTFNRAQFQRIQSMCLGLYRALNWREGDKLLRSFKTHCEKWESADLFQSLIMIPEDMDKFEQRCVDLGAQQSHFAKKPDDIASEDAIAEAVKVIISTEPHRSRAMKLRDRHAEIFVSHLQTTLNKSPGIEPSLREVCIKALCKLAVDAEVLPSSLKIDQVIPTSKQPAGSRGFTDVYQGEWRGKLVAVKRPRIHASKDPTNMLKQARREALLWYQLSHEYILPLLGICQGNPDAIVSGWMPNGSLKAFLKNPKTKQSNRLHFARQLAEGVEYLHKHRPPVVHGGLKAANVFIDSNVRPVIADFVLACSRWSNDRSLSSTMEDGTIRWMAPELLREDKSGRYTQAPTLKSDIFAFARLILEIFTDAEPYGDEPSAIVFKNVAEKRLPPARPASHITERGLTDAVWELMGECWKYSPVDRPTIDYVVKNLRRLDQDIHPTAWNERTETAQVPTIAVGSVINSPDANWNALGVIVSKARGRVERHPTYMTVVSITGDAASVAEARLRISEQVEKGGGSPAKHQLRIPKELHGRIIGQKGRNIQGLEKKHGVKLQFPHRESPKEVVNIQGPKKGVQNAEAELKKIVKFELGRSGVRKVSPRAAQIILERRDEICRPPLRELDVDIDTSTVTLRGEREGIAIALVNIRKIEEEVAREITEDIPVNKFIHDMIESDKQAWADVFKRCRGPACGGQLEDGLVEILPNKLRIRGAPKLVTSLRNEIHQIMNVGQTCVTATRIAARRQESLMGSQGELVTEIRASTGAMVYFPSSGGYGAVGMPDNMDRYENSAPQDIVKLVGSPEACVRAYKYLQDRVEEQRKKEQNPVYKFPSALHHVVKSRVEPYFRTLGISTVESGTPSMAPSLLSFAGNDVIASSENADWTIYNGRDMAQSSHCEWRLESNSTDALRKGGDALVKAAKVACRRIGVLQLQDHAHSRVVQDKLGMLKGQDQDVFFEMVEKPSQLVIAGTSTDEVELVLHKVVALVDFSGEQSYY